MRGTPRRDVDIHRDDDFSTVYSLHRVAVYNRARWICGNDLAYDVTQETFLRWWQLADRFDAGRGTVRALLLRMAHNIAVDMLRSRAAQDRREERECRQGRTVDNDEYDDRQADLFLERDRVDRALRALTDVQQQAVSAVCYGQRSYRQAALDLGIPEGTLKTRVRSGFHSLRPLLLDTGSTAPGEATTVSP